MPNVYGLPSLLWRLFSPFSDEPAGLGDLTAQTADGLGEHGEIWNPFVQRWLMLYNCLDNTPANPRGVYRRVAQPPWGPGSAPQTIFNPQRDGGFCSFIHRAVTSPQPACDQLATPGRVGDYGGEYAPYALIVDSITPPACAYPP